MMAMMVFIEYGSNFYRFFCSFHSVDSILSVRWCVDLMCLWIGWLSRACACFNGVAGGDAGAGGAGAGGDDDGGAGGAGGKCIQCYASLFFWCGRIKPFICSMLVILLLTCLVVFWGLLCPLLRWSRNNLPLY